MKRIITVIFSLAFAGMYAQNSTAVFTSDIDNFWNAYDHINKTDDFSEKISLINKLYIGKGTKGLKAFMEARAYTDTVFVKTIDSYPKFWNSIRPNTLSVKDKAAEMNSSVNKLKELYPDLKEAEMYFTIGALNSGGTVSGNKVLVGTEIATGTPDTDVSEFRGSWLDGFFAHQSLDNIVFLNIHEYIHTQQNGSSNRLLNHSIKEGSCDFIAETVMQKPLQTKYMAYGTAHAEETKALFKKEMFGNSFANWLYNGKEKGERADLGYYIGYEICKSYYHHAIDKKKAVKDIIELNYSDDHAVENFLEKSKFFKEKIDKNKLIAAYRKNSVDIVKTEPANGSLQVDADTKEIKITFSKEIIPNQYSISFSDKGKENFPITKIIGLENNDKTLVLGADLKADKEYEFILTNKKFSSKDGYPLKEEKVHVKFRTK
ncbi:Ig-like domain-containing protein [Chryseobacterium pennipullorum]|uniref:SbsA Ig-like domain-containing protein n=1 Tax=Chryseobacterium pennipullorum TaxID=2258963 RepID=A0A3D9B1C4_9FLAO|nr:Ig-like domain-containing protein [Chryseobacterium pennipullorum]REC47430.1 hypothetical protein DRF67_10310 [Chryseobacterium pennipullorum]